MKSKICVPLSTPINVLFNIGIFSGCLKLSGIMPIFKKGDQQNFNIYRPISVLSNFNKLMEKLLYIRLYKFLNESKCLYNDQFGFRNHHSTNQALISITEKIRTALDHGKYACCVFLDFQKEFDTVNHNILLSKLETYRIGGMSLKLFQNFLMNRTKFVEINKKTSNVLIMESHKDQLLVM